MNFQPSTSAILQRNVVSESESKTESWRAVTLVALVIGYIAISVTLNGRLGLAPPVVGAALVIGAGLVLGTRWAVGVAIVLAGYHTTMDITAAGGASLGVVRQSAIMLVGGTLLGVGSGRLNELQQQLRVELTQRRKAEAKARFLAHYDPLTGLPNRALLFERLSLEVQHAERDGSPIAVMALDMDRFKSVNDAFGHEAGDRVLEEVARRLRHVTRSSDTVARLGGDAFILVLPGLRQAEDAITIAQKILRTQGDAVEVAGQRIDAGASLGIAIFPTDGTDADELLRNADIAMERAKETGRRAFRIFDESMSRRLERRMTLERELRTALDKDEFELHYQPQVDPKTGRPLGVEALIRWVHPELGRVMPGEFIPIAEETGLIESIGEWVIETACRQIAGWIDEGITGLRAAVNLSVAQLRSENLVPHIERVLKETGVPPDSLELEVTEAMVVTDTETAKGRLTRLREMGVHLAIDDFGTGYSSLSYLTRFPVDALKIDRSFVCELEPGNNTEAVVKAILAVGESLALRVVAEGVETEAQRDTLSALGSKQMQGYLFCRPLPATEATSFLKTASRPVTLSN